MKDDNLTRAEAEARAARLSVLSYDVALDLAGDGDTFASTTTVRFQCTEPGADTFVDLDAAAVREHHPQRPARPPRRLRRRAQPHPPPGPGRRQRR